MPYPQWDWNWDGRQATSKSEARAGPRRPTRHIFLVRAFTSREMLGHGRRCASPCPPFCNLLCSCARALPVSVQVRHGQYDETSSEDSERKLTPLGREQVPSTNAHALSTASRASQLRVRSCGTPAGGDVQAPADKMRHATHATPECDRQRKSMRLAALRHTTCGIQHATCSLATLAACSTQHAARSMQNDTQPALYHAPWEWRARQLSRGSGWQRCSQTRRR